MTLKDYRKQHPHSIGNLCYNCTRCDSGCNMAYTKNCDQFDDMRNSKDDRRNKLDFDDSRFTRAEINNNLIEDIERTLYDAHQVLSSMTRFMKRF